MQTRGPSAPQSRAQAPISQRQEREIARDRAKAELLALGVKNVRDGGPRSLHMDDVNGYDVQICGLENNALTDG